MNSDLYKNYLIDLGTLVKENAMDAKKEKNASVDINEKEFQTGRLMAYYELISLMKQQANAFDIDPNQLGLGDIDPERDLL